MSVKVTPSMLVGNSFRLAYLLALKKYLNSSEWKERREKYIRDKGSMSEVSDKSSDLVVHHITYPFKSSNDFSNKDLWGSEKDGSLLLVTNDEHNVIHTVFQSIAHKPRKLLTALKEYYNN